MPNGILGQMAIPALTDQMVYTVPAGKVATITFNLANTTAGTIRGRVCVGADATDNCAYEPGADITMSAPLERCGIVLDAGKKVIVRSPVAGLTMTIYGFEEAA